MTKETRSQGLDTRGRRVLRETYTAFRKDCSWPKLRDLQRSFGPIDVLPLIEALGHERVFCNGSEDPVVTLRLAGLEAVREAADDREIYARAVGFMAERYAGGINEIGHDEFRTALGLDQSALSRLGHLLQVGNAPTRGGTYNPTDGSFTIRLDAEAHFYLGAKTYSRVKKIRAARVTAQEQRFARRHSALRASTSLPTRESDGHAEPPFQLTDPALNETFQRDFQELAIVQRAGAWKATALLAGSCLEAVLLDLLGRQPQEALAVFKYEPQWRNTAGLELLARGAVKLGMISVDMQQFAVAAKSWRDIIHPARAVLSKVPTKELAEALVANLRLLVARVSAVRPGDVGRDPHVASLQAPDRAETTSPVE